MHKLTKIFVENSLSLENVEKILYLMKPSIIEKLKNSILVATKTKNTSTTEKILNQKNLKKLQKFFLLILEKLQLF